MKPIKQKATISQSHIVIFKTNSIYGSLCLWHLPESHGSPPFTKVFLIRRMRGRCEHSLARRLMYNVTSVLQLHVQIAALQLMFVQVFS